MNTSTTHTINTTTKARRSSSRSPEAHQRAAVKEKKPALDVEGLAGELMSIPLSSLMPSPRNVRKTGGTSIETLKASIRAQGLMQNLIVCPAEGGRKVAGMFEVVGGGRRLRALRELADAGEISADKEIICKVKPTREAAVASLAENMERQAMHPADESEAFAALVAEGRSVEDIALTFGVSSLTVRRRLKLAGLHPQLIALYRADRINLDQLMALALTDDQEEQLSVWNSAQSWNRSADALRSALVHEEVDSSSNALAKYVGVQAYEPTRRWHRWSVRRAKQPQARRVRLAIL